MYKSSVVFQETPKCPQLSGSQSMVRRSLGFLETCHWSPHVEAMFIIISTMGTIFLWALLIETTYTKALARQALKSTLVVRVRYLKSAQSCYVVINAQFHMSPP